MKKKIRHVVIGDEDVGIAVLIVVGERKAHPAAGEGGNAGLLRHIFKRAVAPVVIESAGDPLEIFGMAIHANRTLCISAEAIVVRRPFCVVNHPEIQTTVVIVVKPSSGYRPFAAANTRLRGHVFKLAVAKIVIEDVAIDPRDEEVRMAVVVIVSSHGAHRITIPGDARLLSDVAKLKAAFVAIEAVPILLAGFGERRQFGPIREKDVWTSIAIVVEDCNSPGHSLNQVLPRSRTVL